MAGLDGGAEKKRGHHFEKLLSGSEGWDKNCRIFVDKAGKPPIVREVDAAGARTERPATIDEILVAGSITSEKNKPRFRDLTTYDRSGGVADTMKTNGQERVSLSDEQMDAATRSEFEKFTREYVQVVPSNERIRSKKINDHTAQIFFFQPKEEPHIRPGKTVPATPKSVKDLWQEKGQKGQPHKYFSWNAGSDSWNQVDLNTFSSAPAAAPAAGTLNATPGAAPAAAPAAPAAPAATPTAIPPIPVITEEMRAGMTSAQMEELLKQIRAQNDAREALLASQAAGNAALDYLKIKDPEAGATLAATWEHFKPKAGQSAEELAANAKVFKTIEKRRFAVFKEGQRVTSPEGVKAIGEAIKNYQAQPWYVRWGLGGAMMHGLAGMGGATALSALGVIGCLTSPALAGIGIGAATRELVYRWFKRRKDTGADKGMLTKSPHVTGAIIASLFGYGASLAIGPDGIDAIGNFFSKLIKDPSSTLRSLLSLSFLSKKAAVVGATI
jgi:hypothetical protein